MSRESILNQIAAERTAQDAQWGVQNHPILHTEAHPTSLRTFIANTCRSACDNAFDTGVGDWYRILHEEVAEAFEQAALGNEEALRNELIQSAAVIVAMVECLDRNGL